jgi:hypothetical protein
MYVNVDDMGSEKYIMVALTDQPGWFNYLRSIASQLFRLEDQYRYFTFSTAYLIYNPVLNSAPQHDRSFNVTFPCHIRLLYVGGGSACMLTIGLACRTCYLRL